MPELRLPIRLVLLLAALCAVPMAAVATDTARSAAGLVRLQGVVTFSDPARKLITIQDGEKALALHSDSLAQEVRVGERIEIESRVRPLMNACPKFPDEPDGSEVRELFEAPSDWADYFLSRLSGVLRPPVSGEYTFWIASDDSSELWLSGDEQPAHARKIAQVGNGQYTQARSWSRIATQQSPKIRLESGRAYYIEALGQDAKSRDNLAVAWQGPGLEQAVIDGKYISPVPARDGDPAMQRQGVRWEYWTNFFISDFSILRATNDLMLRCGDARVLKREPAGLPAPIQLRPGQPVDIAVGFRLVELEGYVSFISSQGDGWLMELKNGNSRFTARVRSGSRPEGVIPNDSLVRVRGVFEPAASADAGALSGTIWVNTGHDVDWLDTEENWSLLEALPQEQLKASNPELSSGRIVRSQGRIMGQEGRDLWRVEGKDTFQGYVSSDGTNWMPLSPPIEIQMSNTVFAGVAVASAETDEVLIAEFDQVKGLTSALSGVDIGGAPSEPRFRGEFHAEGDRLTVQGKGRQVGSRMDICYFAGQPVKGDLELVARLAKLKTDDPGARAVLMFRESLSNSAPWAAVALMTGNRAGLLSRWEFEGSTTGRILSLHESDRWIKIVRRRNSFLIRAGDVRHAFSPGLKLDVLGAVAWKGDELVLDNARIQILPDVAGGVASSSQSSGVLRDVQIAELRAEAQKAQKIAYHVMLRIRGVVTFNGKIDGEWFSFVQDASGSVRVQWKAEGLREGLQAGDWAELTGTASLAGTEAEFIANGIARLGNGRLPEPAMHPVSDAKSSRARGRWTELEGVVRSVSRDGMLRVKSATGSFEIRSGEVFPVQFTNLVSGLIRARGVFWELPGPSLLLPSQDFIEIIEAPPTAPFAVPSFPIHSLKTNGSSLVNARRLKVSGVVTCRRNDFMMMQDETGGIRVETTTVPDAGLGDAVEVLGFLGQRRSGLSLSEVLLRPAGRQVVPEPVSLSSGDIIHPQDNGVLVSVEALLLDQNSGSDLQTLDVQSGQRAFRATLPLSEGELPSIAAGSRLRLTGVLVANGVETSPSGTAASDKSLASSMELLLRSPGDVVVVERPPWWNWKYTVAASAVVVVVFAGALVWIRMLRRKVEERTHELRETMDKLQRETQISATLAERDRLAGEIHDSIEQGLSAIMMQMDAATTLVSQPEEVKRYLVLARNMANFSRTEVQHAVWDMQSPLLENADLPTALQRVARDISAGDLPRVTVEISGTAFPLPSAVEHHLLRIAQEAMTNAVKHASPRTIQLALSYNSDSLTLVVRDDGVGFVPESLPSDGGHFGLQGMRTRVQKIAARLTLRSRPGAGTCVEVVVPCNERVPEHHANGKLSPDET